MVRIFRLVCVIFFVNPTGDTDRKGDGLLTMEKDMKRVLLFALLACFLSNVALAGGGNGAPSGAHYNLNIIGVENPKKAEMRDSKRHTIFMPLVADKSSGRLSKKNISDVGSNGELTYAQTMIVENKIWLVLGDSFRVCDGNGFDPAYGCADSVFNERWVTTAYDSNGDTIAIDERKIGAVFQLPCNTNLNDEYWDSNGDGVIDDTDAALDEVVRCGYYVDEYGNEVGDGSLIDVEDTASYEVWARALGKPGGSAVTTTCATVRGELQCSLENAVFARTNERKPFTEVTDQLTSLVIGYCQGVVVTITTDGGNAVDAYDICADSDLGSDADNYTNQDLADVTWSRISLFAGNTQDWFWNYDNDGLRLAQLRFYEL